MDDRIAATATLALRSRLGARSSLARAATLAGILATLAGCSTERLLMPTPKLYALTATPTYGRLDESWQGPTAEILFVTDRDPITDDQGRPDYGTGRSRSVGYGAAVVGFDGVENWRELVTRSRSLERADEVALSIRAVEEFARTPPTPFPFRVIDGVPVVDADVLAADARANDKFGEAFQRQLAKTSHKEAFVYIHGVQNTFAESVYTTAELWHFMGREGVPIAYTWPAGGGGFLLGYTYDRESSEFTVYHLKAFLQLLATQPGLEAINLISHSRGTDVITAALRELVIEERARGKNPLETLKVKNLVLAAPDLDIEVVTQRTATARLRAALQRLTIYTSKQDRALGFAELLFGGLRRLGQTGASESRDMSDETLERMTNVSLIEYTGTQAGDFGHNYFKKNPAVASDLVLTVRYDRDPGEANGRPLKHRGRIFWELDDTYLERVPVVR